MLNITMGKTPASVKPPRTRTSPKKMACVKEHEQLYLVKKPGNGALSNGNGFRHHRAKEKRAETPTA